MRPDRDIHHLRLPIAMLSADATPEARRGTIALPEGARAGVVATLPTPERQRLEGLFRKVRRAAPDPPRALPHALERAIVPIVERIDPVPGEAARPDGAP